jgi:hypothetical protein
MSLQFCVRFGDPLKYPHFGILCLDKSGNPALESSAAALRMRVRARQGAASGHDLPVSRNGRSFFA